ncbi:hypothetical protein JHD48_00965 [Sulfurimonas sp. SAG-AH-194-I05]|nr:hypothetical protein [Sulfurimonas sp. SAG-AH-194-I05]MDF1874298.1 hypothetical protein [Sulfurimonas sp. SAG-AH-194-I05]
MKKIIIFLMLSVSFLNAQMVFDLQAQYFSNAYGQNSKASLYALENLNVTTVNLYQATDGRYVTNNASSGTFSVRLTNTVSNFNVSIKAKYKSTYNSRTPSIVLKSDLGEEFVISYDKNEIIIQNKIFRVIGLHDKVLHVNIQKKDDLFVTSINGQVFSKVKLETFVNLKKVEQTINNVGGVSSEDSLYDLTIYAK